GPPDFAVGTAHPHLGAFAIVPPHPAVRATTRTSISHTGIDQPGGPSSQRVTSSGLVWASKTKVRGAANTRVITSSTSPDVVIFSSPCFIDASFLSRGSVAQRAGRRDVGSSLPRAGG